MSLGAGVGLRLGGLQDVGGDRVLVTGRCSGRLRLPLNSHVRPYMNEFTPGPISTFLGCPCTTSEYRSPIHPRSTTYAFKAVSEHGALTLTVNPAQGICFLAQVDASGREVATATVYVTELSIREELDEETGENETVLAGIGPGGHICVSRAGDWFTIFYSMYGDRSRHRSGPSERPSDGLVPSREVAAQIAEAILVPLYGQERIRRQKPFKVNLSSGVWTVEGSYPEPGKPTGIAVVQLRQEDGQVLQVTHGQWP